MLLLAAQSCLRKSLCPANYTEFRRRPMLLCGTVEFTADHGRAHRALLSLLRLCHCQKPAEDEIRRTVRRYSLGQHPQPT